MALNAYLTLKGQKQGVITGSVTLKGREGSIAIHAYSNEIDSPRDAGSGLPTGKRLHRPITILKEADKSSPLLWNALNTNETLTTWQLKFWRPSLLGGAVGTEEQYYTVELVNANIASIREYMLKNDDPDNVKYSMYQELTFTYQKITWTWVQGGITASDDWEFPVV